ncbi:unnamed protein product [Rotaria sp. Silwood1]|nr:unnamed protein product [Rotaria sp. Silwood1]
MWIQSFLPQMNSITNLHIETFDRNMNFDLIRQLIHCCHSSLQNITLIVYNIYGFNGQTLEKLFQIYIDMTEQLHQFQSDWWLDDCRPPVFVLTHSVKTHKLDLNFILRFLSSYNCAQRLILVHDLEFEYNYNLIDMVLEQPESPIRSCTLAMLIEPIELYVRDFHDLLILKLNDKSNSDISRKLVQIVLPLDNDDTQKFKETYKNLFENSIETDIEVVQGEKTIISKLLIQLLEGQRNEEPNHSLSATKLIAKKLSEGVEGGKPVIDYDIFIKIFTHDAFAQLSSIFDMYEDQYGYPIQVAIEHQCQIPIVEYTRSPSGYHAKILRQALDKEPIDYTTLIRTIIGHESKDLCEVKLEYSKMYDETLHQTIEHRIDIAEIKKIFVVIIATGDDLTPRNGEEDCSGDKDSSSSTGAPLNAITSKVMEKKSKHSLDVLEKFAQILKIRTSN